MLNFVLTVGRAGTLPMLAALSLALALTFGCGSGAMNEPVHRMGELTSVGPIVYNVLETEWRTDLGGSLGQVTPGDRFLLIRLTITNSSNEEVAIPLLALENSAGEVYRELSEVSGVPNWLGLLRIIEPTASAEGVIVFDVPTDDYMLRVTDGGDLERERTALIEIPLRFDSPPSVDVVPQ